MLPKVKPVLIAAVIALSGCMQAPPPPSEKPILNGSGEALEKQTSKGLASLVYRNKSNVVSVPAPLAHKRLAAFAEQCINQRTVTVEGFSNRGGYHRTDWHFRAHMAKENGIDRLLILGDADSNSMVIGDKDGFNVLTTTQVLPTGDKTTLKTRHVMMWGKLHTAATQWASTGSTACPDLSKLFGAF